MPSIDLSAYKPISGTDSDAALIDNAFDVLQTAINGGLDNNNIAAGAGIVASKLALTYSDYVPTWSASGTAPAIGNATVVARWAQLGKLIHAYGQITFGSTSTYGTGTHAWALPVSAHISSNPSPIGNVYAFDTSAGNWAMGFAMSTGVGFNSQQPFTWPTGVQQVFAQTVPWTWASGDQLGWNVTYEAA